MKIKHALFVLALPALLAGAAAAQVAPLTPLGRSPLAGLPTLLPSPLTGPYAGMPTVLPAPSLTPSLSAPAPLPAPAAPVAVALPAAAAPLPAVTVDATRENVRHPLKQVVPGVTIRFTGKDSTSDKKEKLDETFDGRRAPEKDAIEPGLRPVIGSERHVSLPEWDLENEIGVR
ncbi:MAG: hypothetical protein KGM24_11375 [Elusimicrobia bacterium]|nr:hypothetical protein [Elusimicrobiota bacterium]